MIRAYLDKGSRNTGSATVQTQILTLGLPDDSPGVLGLGSTQTGQVTTAAAAAAGGATIAVLGNVAAGAGLDVVVAHVAAVGGLVPEFVTVDVGAGGLAGDAEVGSALVGLDDAVVGAGTGAAVEIVGVDGVGAGQGQGNGCGEGEEGEMHVDCWIGRM